MRFLAAPKESRMQVWSSNCRDRVRLLLVAFGIVNLFVAVGWLAQFAGYEAAPGELETHKLLEKGEWVLRPKISYIHPYWGCLSYTPRPDEIPAHYKVGDRFTILYWGRNVKTTRVASPSLFRIPIVAGTLGSLMLITGWFFLRVRSTVK